MPVASAHPRRLVRALRRVSLILRRSCASLPSLLSVALSQPTISRSPCQALIAGPTSNNPVFVSPGHKISLEMSLRLVRGLSEKARVPDPVRAADLAGRAEAKRWQAELDAVSFELE